MKVKPTYKELLNYVFELENKVRELERKLEENTNKTEKLKTTFLGNVSHELRTPMNAILGFSNLLIDKNLSSEKKEEYMEHIHQSSSYLLRLVDTMIDVSLLEANELRINKEYCNLNKLMQQVYYYFNIEKHKINKDHLALLLNIERRKSDFMMYTDHYRLTQILFCLLSNAFKFTNKGIIEFGYFVQDETFLQFYIKDSGKGISYDKMQSIFRRFEKLDEDYGQVEGMGLGLTLAKGIVSIMGGEIWLEKNVLSGATFNFTLPYTNKEEFKNKKEEFTKNVIHSYRGHD